MTRRLEGFAPALRVVGVVLVALSGCQRPHPSETSHFEPGGVPHWGYEDHDGPERWASLSPDWTLCREGKAQSPIDLSGPVQGEREDIGIDYRVGSIRVTHQEHVVDVLDNGHTIQVSYGDENTLQVGDEVFELVQYHFHSPSEHTVDGEHFPMEMHLVHQSPDGELAVVGVFIREGVHNESFDEIWGNLPRTPGESRHLEHVNIDVDELFPSDPQRYRYEGSLTTPPCSEGVHWVVMTHPIELSAEQIGEFRSIFPQNNRPVQARKGREVRILDDDPFAR